MSPDADDASPDPESANEDDSETKLEMKHDANGRPTARPNAKDPSRPRRKKARRACFACQRAHLTCGDERPCERCIKRGLAAHCQDGVRKKAKYLQDAPPEALKSGFSGNLRPNGFSADPQAPTVPAIGIGDMQLLQTGAYPNQNNPSGQVQYLPWADQGQLAPSMLDGSLAPDFVKHQSVESPIQYSSSSQHVSPAQIPGNLVDQSATLAGANPPLDPSYIDTNDPILADLTAADYQFGSHYGALEFRMLGHMSSAAMTTPDLDMVNTIGQNQAGMSYDTNAGFAPTFPFNQSDPSWQTVPNTASRQSSTANVWPMQNNGMHAFAVGDYSTSLTDTGPLAQDHDFSAGFHPGPLPTDSAMAQPEQVQQQQQQQQQELLRDSITRAQQQQQHQHQQRQQPYATTASYGENTISSARRQQIISQIYTAVTAPYPYTQGFHRLTALLQRRFSTKAVFSIAKALASIRPSFISCNKHLNNDDLIFMEKCFQRTLIEYEDFNNQIGTPTVILRRTGEIATASKEFSLITGWRRAVLLGEEPNLNVNTGDGASSATTADGAASGLDSGPGTGTGTRGTATPRVPYAETDTNGPHSLFLAGIMDEESVVRFYQDFAQLAFGASRGSVIGGEVSLLKYKTENDYGAGWDAAGEGEDRLSAKLHHSHQQQQQQQAPPSLMKGVAGVDALGGSGWVKCQLCWTVKRDMFDIPMMVVMNFLPMI